MMYLSRISGACLLASMSLATVAFSQTKQSRAIYQSLRYTYYMNNVAPPLPSKSEIEIAKQKYKTTRGNERKILNQFFAKTPDLLALAMRDLDRDGVRDYRIDESSGKFMEGDIDVDGDGIRNILDVHPYNATRGGRDTNGDGHPDQNYVDRNVNGIPDHVDWALRGKSQRMQAIQKELYHKHKIILVEKTLPFREALAESVYDTVKVVYKKAFQPVLPTLRTITTERRVHLFPHQDEGVSAMMIPQVQIIYLYHDADTGHPLAKLGLVVHEIAHAVQFAFDFQSRQLDRENARVVTIPKRYFQYLGKFGWRVTSSPSKGKKPFRSIQGVWLESRPFSEYLRGKHLNYWQRWINAGMEEYGFAFLKSPEVRQQRFVSNYATADIFEWHAETVMASVMLAISQVAKTESRNRVNSTMNMHLQKTWPEFNFLNLEDSREHEIVMKELGLSHKEIIYLGRKYTK